MFCRQSTPTDSNLQIDAAAFLYSMAQMANQIAPTKVKGTTGFTKIQTKTSTWSCFTSLTGLKMFLETPTYYQEEAQISLQKIYMYYCDYVLKNPFSIPGQPIKAIKFEQKTMEVLEKIK
ncbi:Sybindin-like_family protein [Hexamita inflata]|uniref:Trafficking protein particle complex subunit n=1 Tax=Hexamita inflata TaxID=28002 RepID=A0ABP1HKI7_9EUKA